MKNKAKFKREVVAYAAYDKRNKNPKKNYGVHGVDLIFYLKGPRGVIQFVLYTNWHLPNVKAQWDDKIDAPLPADIGYHSLVPVYEGQPVCQENCKLLGTTCYSDGNSLQAEEVFDILVSGGSDALWAEMERYYYLWLESRE